MKDASISYLEGEGIGSLKTRYKRSVKTSLAIHERNGSFFAEVGGVTKDHRQIIIIVRSSAEVGCCISC